MIDHTLIKLFQIVNTTDWDEIHTTESDDYCLEQFQGTLFGKYFDCYKVSAKNAPLVCNGIALPKTFILKVSTDTEYYILDQLNKADLPVPKVYCFWKKPAIDNQSGYLFEEYIEGNDLYNDIEINHWIGLARELVKTHIYFWDTKSFIGSRVFFERLSSAEIISNRISDFSKAIKTAIIRMIEAPKTLTHNDIHPTNIIIKQSDQVVIIDWAEAGLAPYVADISRLIGSVDEYTLKPYCPYEKEVSEAYYEGIKDLVTYEQFSHDLIAGMLIESAANYDPCASNSPIATKRDKEYAEVMKNRMKELSKIMLL